MEGPNVGEASRHITDSGLTDLADSLVSEALDDGDIDHADFGILFCAPEFDDEIFIDRIDAALDDNCDEWIGCTTAGELSNSGAASKTAVLLLVDADSIDIQTSHATGVYDTPEKAGKEAVAGLNWDADRDSLLFTLIAGETQTDTGKEFQILKGMTETLDSDVPIVGGSAGDNFELEKTAQYYNGQRLTDGVVAAAIQTDHTIKTGQEHGLNQKIKSGVVNESDGRVIHEINGEPAARFYADAIGKSVDDLKQLYDLPLPETISRVAHYLYLDITGQNPLKIQQIFQFAFTQSLAEELRPGELRVLTPINVTEDDGILVTAPVPENQAIHVVEGTDESIIAAGKNAFSNIDDSDNVHMGIIIDCACRYRLLDEDERSNEIELLQDQLDAPFSGFYSYGEIGGKGNQLCTFKNQTVSGFVITDES